MRVGVYIDGFNLYYGGKAWCGAGTRGWRWLDVRSLVASRLPALWPHATMGRVVYCTARVSKGRPQVTTSAWPIMVKGSDRTDVLDARFIASHLHREEKGSDVNVATHLLMDIFAETIEAAVVVSNDSDLALPVRVARDRIPVGVINPGKRPTAGNLRCAQDCGVGSHWFASLDEDAYMNCQLPDPVGKVAKPEGW